MTIKIIHAVPKKLEGRTFKTFKFQVGVFHKPLDLELSEEPEIMAKFRCHGDALVYANHLSHGNVYYSAIIVR